MIGGGELGKLVFLKSTYIVNVVESIKKQEKKWWVGTHVPSGVGSSPDIVE